MKGRLSKQIALGFVLVVAGLLSWTRQASNESLLVSSAVAEPTDSAIVATDAPEIPPAETELKTPPPVPPADEPPVVAEPAPGADLKPLPSTIRSNSTAADVIKMAQSGVDESIMLTFITNSTTPFALNSDEIIYLNDIGVPNNVVTAMIQRDQSLKDVWANDAKDRAAAEAQAAAPAVNPPVTDAPPAIATAPLTPPTTTVVEDDFYDSLSPYGTWVEVEGYGRCWQPTVVVVNRGWRPYSDRGRWVYTDSGWYWMSDYSWGATTFHYGRWFSHPRWGWCWWPDRVWAPSWVSWRYSGDYCGWAPLPPSAYYRPGLGFSYYGRSVGFSFDFGVGAGCFTFVPWRNFCDSRPYHYRVPHREVARVYRNTTIVNNFVTVNNRVVNRGISADRVRERTRTEIPQVNIRESRGGIAGGRGERLERDGRTLVVNRRELPRDGGPRADTTKQRTDQRTDGSVNVPGRPSGGAVSRLDTSEKRDQTRGRTTVDSSPTGSRGSSSGIVESRRSDQNIGRRENVSKRDEKRDQRLDAPVVAAPRTPSPAAPSEPRSENRKVETRERRESSGVTVIGSRNTPKAPVASAPSAASPETKPAPRSIVIGRPQGNQNSGRNVDAGRRDWTPPTAKTPSQVSAVPRNEVPASPRFSAPAQTQVTPRNESREIPRISRGEDRSATPSFSRPAAPQSTPNFARPAMPQAPPATPNFSRSAAPQFNDAPRSAVSPAPRYAPSAPAYNAPAPRAPSAEYRAAPAPQQSQSQPRSESRQDSGRGGGRDRR